MIRHLRDRFNHEYWPWWAIYLPVLPLYLWQALRMRRAAFFTNVNPAIDMGGFFGERKTDIYSLLPESSFPKTLCINAGTEALQAIVQVHAANFDFPLVVKPDVGERGDGVCKVNNVAGLMAALVGQRSDMLVQDLARGEHEFGLMFARDPVSGRTSLLSITGKRFLSVTGDGQHTVDALLSRTLRGERQRARLKTYVATLLDRVPALGEQVQVEPIGNHCRGTTFINAGHLRTSALEHAVDMLVGATVGLYYGRLDVRSESEVALQAGQFTVIELNGVSSEPGHIYDPSWSIWRCWAELIGHVRHIGSISRCLQAQGFEPNTLHDLVCRCEAHFGWRLGAARRLTALLAGRPSPHSPVTAPLSHGTTSGAPADAAGPPHVGRASPVVTAG